MHHLRVAARGAPGYGYGFWRSLLVLACWPLVVACGGSAAPPGPRAQEPERIYRIGFVGSGSPQPTHEGFREGLRDLGLPEGQVALVEYRYLAGRSVTDPTTGENLLQRFATELIAWGAQVLVGIDTPAVEAAAAVTDTVPIVMAPVGNPTPFVGADLARPNRNITGLTSLSEELTGKRLQLLKSVVPNAGLIGVVFNPENPVRQGEWRQAEEAAAALNVRVVQIPVSVAPDAIQEDIRGAFTAKPDGAPVQALMVAGEPQFVPHRDLFADSAIDARLPVLYERNEMVEGGGRGLMSFGNNNRELFRRAAFYVDRLLKGAKPSDLPVERPVRFELVLNLSAAEALGISFPGSVIGQADRSSR